jgi:predicted TIM-barrel fold metal-dependent hydrolase
MVQFAGDERFFVGSDYPHAEGFVEPMKKARKLLSGLPATSVDKILGSNAQRFFGI